MLSILSKRGCATPLVLMFKKRTYIESSRPVKGSFSGQYTEDLDFSGLDGSFKAVEPGSLFRGGGQGVGSSSYSTEDPDPSGVDRSRF